ncbi:cytidylate kinase-like family protein [Fusobacterium simiae]|uniref:Cytidylate kinase-like family protein n=1 Tax=Fusobacterium simiae TaxID=855 RepID=A0ABT4DPQ0_FUSSI|nr:cytidylate kinase-like family protein [Fusobacterium simiae]MCY7009274.1 cytidylate kinase-like family protein [Fusobacterium simiae]
MPKIITISREFGSGGRELGKRLAEELGIPCYDHEIIEIVAKQEGLNPEYVSKVSEKFYPSTIGNRFSISYTSTNQSIQVLLAEREVIKKLASLKDCVIVGRCADVLLKEMKPFNIFVYADIASKLERCSKRATTEEKISAKEMEKKMKKIDKERASYRALFTENKWGNKEGYHLCINTSKKEIKQLIPGIVEYTKVWFKGE